MPVQLYVWRGHVDQHRKRNDCAASQFVQWWSFGHRLGCDASSDQRNGVSRSLAITAPASSSAVLDCRNLRLVGDDRSCPPDWSSKGICFAITRRDRFRRSSGVTQLLIKKSFVCVSVGVSVTGVEHSASSFSTESGRVNKRVNVTSDGYPLLPTVTIMNQ